MKSKTVGYKAKTQLTAHEKEEHRILSRICDNLEADILGDAIVHRFQMLSLGFPDSGMIYCPQIPIMKSSIINNDLMS